MTVTLTCRIGLGLGATDVVHDAHGLAVCATALERYGFDSLWTSDVVSAPSLDPLVALSFAAAVTTRLRLGTSVLVGPGRVPARLAKELASIDVLSRGRFLPMLGLGVIEDVGTGGLGVERSDRGPMLNELIPLLRRLWTEDRVDHSGAHFRLEGFQLTVRPARDLLPIWLGGRTRPELARAGRLADGWLASFATPAEVGSSIETINSYATDSGRSLDADHFGALIPYTLNGRSTRLKELMDWRRPDVCMASVAPSTASELVELLQAMLCYGASKFVLVPVDEPGDWTDHLAELASACGALDDRITAASSQ